MKNVPASTRGAVVRTSLGMRDFLFDVIDDLRAGTTTDKQATAMSRVAAQINNSVKIEIEHNKHIATVNDAQKKINPTGVLVLGSGVSQPA